MLKVKLVMNKYYLPVDQKQNWEEKKYFNGIPVKAKTQ